MFNRFPYTNFHELNLDWVLQTLKDFGAVIDGLDAEISKIVSEQLSAADLAKMILDTLTSYGVVINVKAPPAGLTAAVGDGTADDTVALQGCIDYANSHNGLRVYLPSGSYLSQSLTLKDNVSLYGSSRATTKIVLKGGATAPLINGASANNEIANITLNGNAEIQVNSVDTINLTGRDYNIYNLFITGGYELMNINSTTGNVILNNIIFEKSTFKSCVLSGAAHYHIDTALFNEISEISGTTLLEINSNGTTAENIYCTATVPTAISLNANNCHISAQVNNATNSILDNGTENSFSIYGEQEVVKLSGTKKITAKDLILDTTNSATYKTPSVLNNMFKTIPLKDTQGDEYSVLVRGENINEYGDNLTALNNEIIKKINYYDTVAIMKSDTKLTEGMTIITNGYYSANDGGGAVYKVVSGEYVNSGLYQQIGTGNLFAKLVSDPVNVDMLGAKGDGIADDLAVINYAMSNIDKFEFTKGKTYKVGGTITITKVLDINLNGATIIGTTSPIIKINIPRPEIMSNMGMKLKNAVFNCGTNTGLEITYCIQGLFENIRFKNISGTGFIYSGGFESTFKNMYFYGDGTSACVGMNIASSDCDFYNIYGYDVKTFIKSAGTNKFTDCHAWIYTQALLSGSVYAELNGNTCYFNGCYSDTYEKTFLFKTITTIVVNNFYFFLNPDVYTLPISWVCFYEVDSSEYCNIVSGVLQGQNTVECRLSNQAFHGYISSDVVIYNFGSHVTHKTIALTNVNSLISANNSTVTVQDGTIYCHFDFTIDLSTTAINTPINLFDCSVLAGKARITAFDFQSEQYGQICGRTYAYLDGTVQMMSPGEPGVYHCSLHFTEEAPRNY